MATTLERATVNEASATVGRFLRAGCLSLAPLSVAAAIVAAVDGWDGGVASCNGFGYKFSNVSIATRPGGGWQRLVSGTWLQDPGYRVQRRSPSVFLAGRA